MVLIFSVMLLLGALYLLLVIFGGFDDALDFGIEGALEGTGLDAVMGIESADGGENVGCMALAAFLTTFGAVGLGGTLAGSNILVVLVAALLLSVIVGRGVASAIRFAYNQQSTDVFSASDLVGKHARVTMNARPGETSEAMIEDGQVMKYPIREIHDAELSRGDTVVVVQVDGAFLGVEKSEEKPNA